MGLAFVATAVTRPFAGAAADRGRPQRFVLLGGVLVALGSLVSAVAASVVPLLLGRVVMGAGEAFLFGAAIPWVLSAYAPSRRGRVSGLFGLSMWGGLALGPVCASAVQAAFGPRQVWLMVIVLAVTSSAVAGAAAFSPPPVSRAAQAISLAALVPRSALLPGVVFGCAGYGYGAVSAGLVLFMNYHHVDSAAGLPAFAVAFLGIRAVGSGVVDRYGGPVVAVGSLVVAMIGAAVLTCAASLALLGAILLGAGTSLMFPATVAWSLRRRRAGATAGPGTSIGVSTSFWDLGIAAGGLLTGVTIHRAGYPAAWAISAILLAVAAVTAAARIRPG